MSEDQNTTFTGAPSTIDYRSQLGINLSDMNEVADSIKTAMDNGQIKTMGDISATISPDKISSMIQDQMKLMNCTLASLGGTSILGQSGLDSTLNTALSTVMSAITCSFGSMQSSMAKIDELTKKMDLIKSSLKINDIDALRTIGK